MNSGFRPEAGKSSGNTFSPSSTPLMPSTECACNPNTPPDYLRFLTQFPNLHADLALNPALPSDLEQWIKGHPDPRVQQNLRVRAQKLTDSGNEVDRAKQSSVSSSTEAAEADEATNEENFDATTLAGSKSPVTKSLPAAPGMRQQSKAALPPEISPAVTGNLPPLTPTQSLPQPAAYSPGMPSAAPYAPSPNFAPGFPPPPGAMGYQPLPGQYPKPRRKRRWLIPLIATLVTIAVVGGGLGVYFALASFRHIGYSSPQKLAEAVSSALSRSDVIEIARMSAPSEENVVKGATQLNKDLEKYISKSESSQKASVSPDERVADFSTLMENLDLDTSRLNSNVESLSEDMARLNYSGTINLKIKDKDKLKASLDKVVFNGISVPDKEKQIGDVIDELEHVQKQGININPQRPFKVMAVKENNKWYYSVSASIFENNRQLTMPGQKEYNYKANWANPGDTPSNASEFSKELSATLAKVNTARDLFSDDCMRFLDVAERRLLMVYTFGSYDDPSDISLGIRTELSAGSKSNYGVTLNLDSFSIDTTDMKLELTNTKYNYDDGYSRFSLDLAKYLKNEKLQLVAKDTNQGLKLSFSGTFYNLLSDIDLDYGNEYYSKRKNRDYLEGCPALKEYEKIVFGTMGIVLSLGDDVTDNIYDYSEDSVHDPDEYDDDSDSYDNEGDTGYEDTGDYDS